MNIEKIEAKMALSGLAVTVIHDDGKSAQYYFSLDDGTASKRSETTGELEAVDPKTLPPLLRQYAGQTTAHLRGEREN